MTGTTKKNNPTYFKNPRRHLSADALHEMLRRRFGELPDQRSGGSISIQDALMAAFAMFSLKEPSLLAFDALRSDENLKRLYGIGRIPCDTQMRTMLDPLDPDLLRPCFTDIFRPVQRGNVLKSFRFLDGAYLLSVDGTEYFRSPSIHCESCLQKVSSRTGTVTYYHQAVAAVLVHPDHREVIPLAVEPIERQDGQEKNDCEHNAAKRLLRKLRQDHPHLPLILLQDGLFADAPYISALQDGGFHFIISVKPGDHQFLFDYVIKEFEQDRVSTLEWQDGETTCQAAFLDDVPLSASHQEVRVQYLQYAELDAAGHEQKSFTWISDLPVDAQTVPLLVRGGRCRWKVENETFNTLKNQGYQFEHNFGHGHLHLSVVFMVLMMLAFLVDQLQQLCNATFRLAYKRAGAKTRLWERLRSHFLYFRVQTMQQVYEGIASGAATEVPLPIMPPYLNQDDY